MWGFFNDYHYFYCKLIMNERKRLHIFNTYNNFYNTINIKILFNNPQK